MNVMLHGYRQEYQSTGTKVLAFGRWIYLREKNLIDNCACELVGCRTTNKSTWRSQFQTFLFSLKVQY